jgi:hypothetical protein
MRRLVLAAILFVITGCGGGGGATQTVATANATGTWTGSFTSSLGGTHQVTLNLVQNGSSLSGAYSTSTGAVGTASGSVVGNMAIVTFTMTSQGCNGTFSGSAMITEPGSGPSTMACNFSGSTTCGGNETDTGTLTKQ